MQKDHISSRVRLSKYPKELTLREFLDIIKENDPRLENSLRVREMLQKRLKKK